MLDSDTGVKHIVPLGSFRAVCSPECKNGGKCVGPDECECPAGHTGQYTACTSVVCSHLLPCYPGMCVYPDSCDCDIGFIGTGQDACLTMTSENGTPEIALSTFTLSRVNRTDATTTFAYIIDWSTRANYTHWSNQNDFNYLKFEFQSIYEKPSHSHRPFYVRSSGFGIVNGTVIVNISKIPRSGTQIRVVFTKQYDCLGLSDITPKDIANCIIIDDMFFINLEHGDWFNVVFTAKSGGYRELIDTSQSYGVWKTQIYYGQTVRKEVGLKFDFELPLHCSESGNSAACRPIDTPLQIENEFTKEHAGAPKETELPINISWAGWVDDLSGMERYHLEAFKLAPDTYGNLEEISPLNPVYYTDFNHTHENIYHHCYTPKEDGMYSVLLEAADKANNSKIARRLVLYSPTSNVSLNENDDSKIFVSTALRETGYIWQTAKIGTIIEITVEWANHFVNKFIEDGNLLNTVKPYPIQFREIQKYNILHSSKYVSKGFDDDEGARTTRAKPNKHGIVRFEAVKIFSDDADLPVNGWFDIDNLAEKFSFNLTLDDERRVRIWVRAHDVLGNTIVDGTEVNFDATGPIVVSGSVYLLRNQLNGTYKYTSRLIFRASDHDSGLHKVSFTLTRDDTGEVKYTGFVSGSSKNITGSCRSHLECVCVRETCFLSHQTFDLDNCWFMTAKEELDHVSVTLDVIVYNQALLSNNFSIKIDKLDTLKGLEKYSGPTNIHVAQNLPDGVRLEWDLPEAESCYGRTDIVIVLYMHGSTNKLYPVRGTSKYLDILGLNLEYNNQLAFSLHHGNQSLGNMLYNYKTGAIEEPRIKDITRQQSNIFENKIELLCQLSTDAQGSALWLKNASRIVPDWKYITFNTTLTIFNIEETDQYDSFSCANDLDIVRSNSYRIRIDGPDSITFIPDKRIIDEFGSLNITCLADCYMSCSFQWIKSGVQDIPEMLVSDLATMQIGNATSTDAGNYSCIAKNTVSNKTIVASITLDVIHLDGSRKYSPDNTKIPDKGSPVSDTVLMSLLTIILLSVAVIFTCLICGVLVYKSRKRQSNNINTVLDAGLPSVDLGIRNEFDLVHIEIDPVTNYWTIGTDTNGGLRTVIDETFTSIVPGIGSRPCSLDQTKPSETLESRRLQSDEDAYIHPI